MIEGDEHDVQSLLEQGSSQKLFCCYRLLNVKGKNGWTDWWMNEWTQVPHGILPLNEGVCRHDVGHKKSLEDYLQLTWPRDC